MKIEVTQCSMCKHYSEEQYCEIWQQYITNDTFYCACGAKADRKTENSSEKPNNFVKDINVRSKDEPTTQTETQNSNLTFKTLEYCDICDHKGCEECIANALDEHCMPSQFNKQIEDECAKEYEELGLKELKELIEADRKTEPTISKMEQVEDEPQTDCSWK